MRAIGVLVALSAVLSVWCDVPEYRIECGVWRNVTDILNHKKGTMMSCEKNVQCTGFDCNGLYEYQGLYSMDQEVKFTYCFGIAIHPCHQPVNLHIYIDIPDEGYGGIHFQENVANTTDIPVPGFHYELGEFGKLDGFIHVDMTRKIINGHRYAEIGMVFKVRVQGSIAIVGEWPDKLQQTLMPKTDIPIPACERDVVTPTHIPSTCVKYTTPKPATPIPTPKPTPATTLINHVYTGSSPSASNQPPITSTTVRPTTSPTTTPTVRKACVPKYGYSCGEAMMCDPYTKVCVCQSDYQFNGQDCMPVHYTKETTTVIFIPDPAGATIIPNSDGTHNFTPPYADHPAFTTHAIIIGVSVSCVVLLMGIIGGILFYKFRKHQVRYGNHQLLINNEGGEEDDDDDPIDVST